MLRAAMSGESAPQESGNPGDPVSAESVIKRGSDGRVIYPESYAVYASRYDRSARTIRSWVARGIEVGELPPLHDPPSLCLWITAHSDHKVPAQIEALAVEWEATGRAPSRPSGELFEPRTVLSQKISLADSEKNNGGDRPAPKDDAWTTTGDLDDEEVGDRSGDEGLRQARKLSGFAWKNLSQALKDNNKSAVERWMKAWRDCIQTQRSWEKDINKIMEERGELIRKSVLVSELVTLAVGVGRNDLIYREYMVEAMLNLGDEEREKLKRDPKARRAFCVSWRDQAYQVLQKTTFARAFAEAATSRDEAA